MPTDPATPPTREQLVAAMRHCPRSIWGHGRRSPGAVLAEVAWLPELDDGVEHDADGGVDVYGEGGVVAVLEAEVAEVLGAEAAVAMPTGTMAQQIALRIHCDRRGLSTVALHPTAHQILHEAEAMQLLHRLTPVRLGDAARPWAPADVEALAEPVAAVGLELPLRELGGVLPGWEDVTATVQAAGDRDAAVHLDGARLWEAAAGYGHPPAQLAALADSTYVSFYKGLGAPAGVALVGDPDLIERARVWRHRHGGAAYAMWPWAAPALRALRTRLDRMGSYLEVVRDVAAGLAGAEGIEVVPAVPHTSHIHLHLEVEPDAFARSALALAEEEGVRTWPASQPTPRPSWRLVELAVGDAAVEMGAEEVVAVIRRLVTTARGG